MKIEKRLTPLLSVVVITYQHEKYVRKCLDSILMQETDFRYDVIIGDDCSKDNTPIILGEYKEKYPDLIKTFIRPVNLGATRNQYECFLECNGEFIAILDGDDFWTNPLKLQTQVDFLRGNPDYIANTQRYRVVDQFERVVQETYEGPGKPNSGDYSLKDFRNYVYYGHPGTLVFRNIFLCPQHDYSIIYKADRFIGDITLGLILTLLGKIYVSDVNMTSYRNFQVLGETNFCSTIARKNLAYERIDFLNKLEAYSLHEFKIELRHRDRMPFYIWWSILFMAYYPSEHNWAALKKICSPKNLNIKVVLYIVWQIIMLPLTTARFVRKKMIRAARKKEVG